MKKTITLILINLFMFSCTREKELKIIIATPFEFNESKIDPARVENVQDATIARAMYGSLLEYNKEGKLILGLASNYSIEGNNVTFEVGKKSKLSNGEYLSVRDVEYTFKRNIILGKTTHSKFNGLVCNDENIKNIEQDCNGIVVNEKENKITFILRNESLIDSFISVVTSHDFRIIPRAALNKYLEIDNHKLVSGPFYFERISENKNEIELRANEFHYKHSMKNPQVIILKQVNESDLEKKFINKEIDVIPMFHFMNLSTFKRLSIDNNYFKTEGIKNFFIRFTDIGFKKFSNSERVVFGRKFKDKYLKINPTSDLFTHGKTVFPMLSEAYLDQGDLSLYDEKFQQEMSIVKTNKKLRVGLTKNTYEKVKNEIKEEDPFEVVLLEKSINQLKNEELPDAYLETIDSTFTDTASAIVYALRVGVYGFDHTESDLIIKNLYSEKDQNKKIELIKKVHMKILMEGRAVSFGHAPYVAISNKQWNINFSKFYAATSFLDITLNE